MVFGGQVDKQSSHLIKVAEFCFWLHYTQKQVSPSPTHTPFFSHFALGVRYQNLSTELGFFLGVSGKLLGFLGLVSRFGVSVSIHLEFFLCDIASLLVMVMFSKTACQDDP
jgi:hypothetical protein